MEDIYGNLNNYEDVIALEELRSENKELKVKLKENSTAMEKLQNDYDNLEMEFKKLEKNYSSLLKTARSEIQRKTERITQLNTEKDMMVLDALKSGKNIRRNFNQGVKNPGRMNYEGPGRGNNKNKKDYINQKNVNVKQERLETPVLPTNDAGPDSGTHNRNKSDNAAGKVEITKKSNVNENIAQHKTELSEPPRTSAGSIKDRRKSMSAVSMPIDTVSSENELERNFQTKDTKTDPLPTDKFDRGHKTSETSSAADRGHNHYEYTSRDNYKGRSSRYPDNSSYRGRDKYEVSLKYRKQYSPERIQKRQYRDHPDDYHRYERSRYQGRSLESPPPESYNRHQRRKPDHRSDYDRCFRDYDKNRYHYDDKHSAKYRSKDNEEPQIKRQRTESYGNLEAHSKDDWRPYYKRDSMDPQPAPNFSPYECDMLRYSCQSPDFVHTEASLAIPIREIKATATTPLEDPRVTSKRYVIWKENGKETLSTVVGMNIDVRPVNKAVWNFKPVDIPFALVHRPSQCSEQLLEDINMDIDNPVTNLDISIELDEVCETDDEIHEIRSNPKEIKHDTQEFKISKQITGNLSKQANNAETVSKPNIAKYRTQKIGHNSKNIQIKRDVPIIELDENVQHYKNVYKKAAPEESFPKELSTRKQQYNECENFVLNDKNYCKMESREKSRSRERGENQNQTTLTKMAIVADDLELSDDNIDHMDTNRKVALEKLQKNCEMSLFVNEARTDNSVNNVKNKTLTSSHNTKIERTVDTNEIKDVAEEEKTKESNSTKKQKTKKKKSKSKEISKDSVQSTAEAVDVSEKKQRSKKEKESTSKETKVKFSELFGDSNSLMTPEDLGIPSYLPISEDTQDAVDMKINQIIDAAPLIDTDEIPSDIQTQSRVEVQKAKAHDDIPKAVLRKSNTDVEHNNISDNEIKKKKSSKKNEEMRDTNQLPSPIVYENLNAGTDLNDPNVVKTVIISTGIQPAIAYENKIDLTKPATDVEVSAIQNTKDVFPAATEFKRDILKALATSTPQKEFSAIHSLDEADVISDPCLSKAVATITNAEQVVNQTEKNTLESNDAPDVRIFVKRRRKVLKRPLMT